MFKNVSFFKSNSTKKVFNENYTKSLESIKNNTEYTYNKKQIEIITNLLVEHADVPKELVDLLIDSVKKNVAMEYKNFKYTKI